MKRYMSYSWKGVVVVLVMLMGFVSAAQAFALGYGLQEYREVGAASHVEPTFEQVDATFEVEPTFFEVEPTLPPLAVDAVTSRAVTLSAIVRELSGASGTVDFTFEIEEPLDALDPLQQLCCTPLAGDDPGIFPATFPGQMGIVNKEDSSIPEPSTMMLVGLGALGMIIVRKLWEKQL